MVAKKNTAEYQMGESPWPFYRSAILVQAVSISAFHNPNTLIP